MKWADNYEWYMGKDLDGGSLQNLIAQGFPGYLPVGVGN